MVVDLTLSTPHPAGPALITSGTTSSIAVHAAGNSASRKQERRSPRDSAGACHWNAVPLVIGNRSRTAPYFTGFRVGCRPDHGAVAGSEEDAPLSRGVVGERNPHPDKRAGSCFTPVELSHRGGQSRAPLGDRSAGRCRRLAEPQAPRTAGYSLRASFPHIEVKRPGR